MNVPLSVMMALISSRRSVRSQSSFRGRIGVSREMIVLLWFQEKIEEQIVKDDRTRPRQSRKGELKCVLSAHLIRNQTYADFVDR